MKKRSWTDQFFCGLLKAFSDRAVEITRIRTTAAGIRIIQGVRYLFILHYFFLLASFVGSLSLFFSAYLLSIQTTEPQGIHLTWPLGVCIGLFLVSTLIFIFTLREKTWIRVFQIDRLVAAALGERGSPTQTSSPQSTEITPEAIAKIVEKVLEDKFLELANREKQNLG